MSQQYNIKIFGIQNKIILFFNILKNFLVYTWSFIRKENMYSFNDL